MSLPERCSANVSCSDMYRSIVISSIVSKMLDNVIIEQQQLSLPTSPYKFRLKSKTSRALCTTMIVGISLGISYHLEKRNHSVCLLLLDASKAFDKVSFDISFKLLPKKLCIVVVQYIH